MISNNKPIRYASEDDCRAIKQDGILWKAMTDGELAPLVELVKNKTDLELCFRGNSQPDKITVYYNNNEFLSYTISGNKIKPEYNKYHARYFEGRMARNNELDSILKDPGNFEEFYKLRKEVMESYFDENQKKDYIRDPKGYLLKGKKKCRYEKMEQQKLMTANTNRKNGYYIYDMEYAQAFDSQEVKEIYESETESEKHNKPDALAIRYEDGKPKALVFIELKTTESAMKGKCSAIDHIVGMKNFVKWDKMKNRGEFIQNRLTEAQKIMEEYKLLGLHNCGERPVEDFSKLKVELLLVITGNERKNMPYSKTAKAYYENDIHKKIINEAAKVNNCGILVLDKDKFELHHNDIINLELK